MKGGVAVNSGTSALHICLLALGIKKGDEVILPTYICTAPLNAIYYSNATPVVVDINWKDLNISISEVKKKLTSKTKAIIVPHIFGTPAGIDEFLALGIPVIEDCAHSIGAKYKGKRVGSLGLLSIFSFYATKMLTTGEGGMVLSNNEKLLSKIRDMRDYDEKDNFRLRFNYKMTDIEAVLGLSQLKKLPEFIKKRKEIAEKYNKIFSGNFNTFFNLKESVFYRYIIEIKGNAETYINRLKNKGVECRKPVYKPLHQYLGLKGFPVAEKIHQSTISIPIYPSLTDKEMNFIGETVTALKGGAR